MWISREDYKTLQETNSRTGETRDKYFRELNEARRELAGLKRSLMPTKHYQVIDTNSGLRYDVNAVDYFFDYDHYEGRYCVNFRKADYSVVLSIHKDVSIQVMGEE